MATKDLPYASLLNKVSIKDLIAQKQNDIPNGKVNYYTQMPLAIIQFFLECLGVLSFQVLCRLLNSKCKASEKYFMDFLEVSIIKLPCRL